MVHEATLGATPTNIVEGRLGRFFDSSTCTGFNFFPGKIGVEDRTFEELGPFCNPSDTATTCVTVTFSANDCVEAGNSDNFLVIPAAYTEFDPATFDRDGTYLGTIGENTNVFQFLLAGGQQFVVVGQQVLSLSAENNGVGCTFGISVAFDDECDAP